MTIQNMCIEPALPQFLPKYKKKKEKKNNLNTNNNNNSSSNRLPVVSANLINNQHFVVSVNMRLKRVCEGSYSRYIKYDGV